VKATKVNAGLTESNGRLLLGIWRDSLHVTCWLTACTPGSAPGPTLGNEYGKTLPFFKHVYWPSLQSDQNLRGPHVARQQQLSIDICARPQQQTRRATAAADRRERQTDGPRPLHDAQRVLCGPRNCEDFGDVDVVSVGVSEYCCGLV